MAEHVTPADIPAIRRRRLERESLAQPTPRPERDGTSTSGRRGRQSGGSDRRRHQSQEANWMAMAQTPTVQPGEVVLAGVLIKFLTEATGSEKPGRAVEEVRRILPSIWTRLQSLAAAEPTVELYSYLVGAWREFYELDMPEDRRQTLDALLETEGESAIGLARLAQVILQEKCPNGALGAALLNL